MTRSRIVRFVALAACSLTYSVGVGQRRRYESFEYRTRAFREGIESPKTFFADDRTSIFVEDRDRAPADHEAPLASHAVVEPRRAPKQFAVTLRSDHEVVFEPNRSLRSRGFAPQVHDAISRANSVPERSCSKSRASQNAAANQSYAPCCKTPDAFHFAISRALRKLSIGSVVIRGSMAIQRTGWSPWRPAALTNERSFISSGKRAACRSRPVTAPSPRAAPAR